MGCLRHGVAVSGLTGRRSAQGGGHRDRAREQARGPRGQARARGRAGGQGDRRVQQRVFERGPEVLRPHRRRLQRDADEGRNRRGRPDERNRGVLPADVRRAEPPVPAPAEAPRARAQGPRHVERRRGGRRRMGGGDQPRPREAPAADVRGARARGARRGGRGRGVQRRVFVDGPPGLPDDRQGQLGHAREAGDRRGLCRHQRRVDGVESPRHRTDAARKSRASMAWGARI